MRALALVSVWLALLAAPAAAQDYIREDLRLPMAEAGPKGLETLFVRPAEPGRYPLVIISHGAPRKAEDRPNMTPGSVYLLALEFTRRGFAVAVVMRRGYGASGGSLAEGSGPCDNPDYVRSGRTAAQDIKAAIVALGKRSDVDAARVIAVGQSAGGLGTVALAADPPPGLIAAINFAGGRGSRADFDVCTENRLVDAFGVFGKTSRLPMLWVYTANDHFFEPKLAEKFHDAFKADGGRVQFIRAPAFGKDGHSLFSISGIPRWTAYVDNFLADNNLTQRAAPAPLPPLPALAPPSQLNARGRESFDRYRLALGSKAFAVSSDGYFGWQSGRRSMDDARRGALKLCEDEKRKCDIVFVDNAPAP
ncbi:alpha/beta hydrolase family protein [Undibacter mobilis]|uniref:Dienelactone hydrolase n=1 Tax=Undibacter mobilis TaxID=2292256 RepID=A0A371BCA8_9BRAD|nr:CocE/NonD family hydrolase [Undibacter mobilis]RDV05157.1 dienelactone hydrolase [Undibacter mobilis]